MGISFSNKSSVPKQNNTQKFYGQRPYTLLWIPLAYDSGHPHDSGPAIFATLVTPFCDRRHRL